MGLSRKGNIGGWSGWLGFFVPILRGGHTTTITIWRPAGSVPLKVAFQLQFSWFQTQKSRFPSLSSFIKQYESKNFAYLSCLASDYPNKIYITIYYIQERTWRWAAHEQTSQSPYGDCTMTVKFVTTHNARTHHILAERRASTGTNPALTTLRASLRLYGSVMDFVDGMPTVDSLSELQFNQVKQVNSVADNREQARYHSTKWDRNMNDTINKSIVQVHSNDPCFGDLRPSPNVLITDEIAIMIIYFDWYWWGKAEEVLVWIPRLVVGCGARAYYGKGAWSTYDGKIAGLE